ncbi:MAG: DUF2812 domain-containing protein [Ruminococcus sp.]|nr:DUF2812 domain-containing protein [Ruminococcus sp.]
MSKQTVTKFKIFVDLDKEINFINSMNKKGWKLVSVTLGCLYQFVKTESCEYVTVLHAEKVDKIKEVADFAKQCGYEIVPHKLDGITEIIYLTGKKSEVTEEFVSDSRSKIRLNQCKIHSVRGAMILFLLSGIGCVFCTVKMLDYVLNTNFFSGDTVMMIFLFIATMVDFIMIFKLSRIIKRYNNKIKKLEESLHIYE